LVLLSTILWGIYVYYTIKTFKEIRKQTELQNDAFLVIRVDNSTAAASSVLADSPRLARGFELRPAEKATMFELLQGRKRPALSIIPPEAQNLINKWSTICTNNLKNVSIEQIPIILFLKNHGKAEIISWTITFNINVEPSANLATNNIGGDKQKWKIQSTNSIGADQTIAVEVFKSGPFPSACLTWVTHYVDARNKHYTACGGDLELQLVNAFTNPSPEKKVGA
jgi:hypothetical protein